jgi:alpha-D-ribose 1-methylphosphonate 5-triphosphate synthase subunit PhnG
MTTTTIPPEPAAIADRQGWLAVLAASERASLARLVTPWLGLHRQRVLRAPETGLVMLRARVSRGGDRFNVGEVPVTRCALRLCCEGLDEDDGPVGVGYVLGRDAERALWTATLDALLQHPDVAQAQDVRAAVLQPLTHENAARRARDAARAATSRVEFFTVQGETS